MLLFFYATEVELDSNLFLSWLATVLSCRLVGLYSWSDPDTTQQGVTLDGADGSVRGSGDAVEAAKSASVDAEAVGDEQSTGTTEGDRTTTDTVRTLGPVVHAAPEYISC